VRHAGDHDTLRFTLTSEAGMNDGSGFPFVMLGLALLGVGDTEIGSWGWRWFLTDVVWATAAAIFIGLIGGALLGQLSWALRNKEPKHEVLDDLVGLGLIALVYSVCELAQAWGFLAVFFAGLALRHTELVLAGAHKNRHGLLVPDDVKADPSNDQVPDPETTPLAVSAEALIFKEHLERLSELTLVLLLGGILTLSSLNWRTWETALFLFLIARPASVMLGLAGTGLSMRIKCVIAWFGVRGIGSIYYLMYAINHGLPAHLGRDLIQITVVVVSLSIIVHGVSVKPLMEKFGKKRKTK
jgi:NhaP-type Na+/H+ or K+/H+ antiporter